ncbi:MAG: hypothetical protein ACYS0G_00645 [Planctomycetota bacterium]|jgi:hypothetical protein
MTHLAGYAVALWLGVGTVGVWAQTGPPELPPPAPAPPPGGAKAGPGDDFPLLKIGPPQDGQAVPVVGSLAIQAVQGTPGGPPIGSADVQVRLFHQGMLIDTIDTRLDAHGVTLLKELPLPMEVQPVVQVTYADMTYQKVGAAMSAAHPQQSLEVVCYEATEAMPEWMVPMRHVMIDTAPEGLRVMEVIVIDNPGDHTWIGGQGDDGKRVTTVFTLPEGARDVALGSGFHDWCCTTWSGGRLVNHLPLMPERTEMKFSYLVPADHGSAWIDIVAPAPVDHLMVVVPDELETAAAEGLVTGGSQVIGDRRVRSLMAGGQARGDVASISLTGLTTMASEPGGGRRSAALAKIVAAAGGGLILVLAVIIIFSKSARSPAPAG